MKGRHTFRVGRGTCDSDMRGQTTNPNFSFRQNGSAQNCIPFSVAQILVPAGTHLNVFTKEALINNAEEVLSNKYK